MSFWQATAAATHKSEGDVHLISVTSEVCATVFGNNFRESVSKRLQLIPFLKTMTVDYALSLSLSLFLSLSLSLFRLTYLCCTVGGDETKGANWMGHL